MNAAATITLAGVAAGIGALHTLAPDHWVPFAALARAERWSTRRTALVTGACGLGHVTASVALGLAGLSLGLEVIARLGERLERVAGLMLIAFGVVYGLWGLHRAMHHHHHHSNSDRPRTAWTLFVLFSADPCVAVIPLLFAAAPLGLVSTVAVVAAYEIATIATMVGLAVPARVAVSRVRGAWADRYGDAVAGGAIAAVGVAVAVLGI